jgi:uncharacterized membrane protein YfcA
MNKPFMSMDTNTLLILLIVGLFAGFLSGMVGVGGGIIVVPALVFFLGMTQHAAQGVSIGMLLLPVGFMAAFNYYKTNNLNMVYSLTIGLTFIVGAYVGSKVSLGIDETTMRRIFGVLLVIIAIRLIFSK